MKKLLLAGLLCAGLTPAMMAQPNIVNEASQLELKGRFKEAAALLQSAIKTGKGSPTELKTLEFELDRLERIRQD